MPRRVNHTDSKLGARIAALGYTVGEVAEGAGVDRWHLNDYMHGRKSITPLHMVRLCAFLKCQPESLVD
jgi:plasmid maintenance system antidote protein VapI